MQSGRIYAEVDGAVNTAVAFANISDADTDARVSFVFTDQNGSDFGAGSLTLGPKQQMAGFLNQPPFNVAGPLRGTFTFTASFPVSVIAIRGLTNQRQEFLTTALEVASIGAPSANLSIPHVVDGGGWSTDIALVNPTGVALTGRIQLRNTDGSPVTPEEGIAYAIAPRSSFVVTVGRRDNALRVGSAQVLPDPGNPAPYAAARYSLASGGVVVSETGVVAIHAAQAFRLYVEAASGPAGRIQTAIAIANPSPDAVSVRIEPFDLSGNATAAPATVMIPGFGEIAAFASEMLRSLPADFQGVLRITASVPVAVAGLRARYNERGDFLTAATPAVDETKRASTSELVFPQVVDGGGYTMQFVLMSGSAGQSSSGIVQFFSQNGAAFDLSLLPAH
jgi:hypothetical protein